VHVIEFSNSQQFHKEKDALRNRQAGQAGQYYHQPIDAYVAARRLRAASRNPWSRPTVKKVGHDPQR
jgi:hypothetical protein